MAQVAVHPLDHHIATRADGQQIAVGVCEDGKCHLFGVVARAKKREDVTQVTTPFCDPALVYVDKSPTGTDEMCEICLPVIREWLDGKITIVAKLVS